MNKKEIQEKINNLRKEIEKHNHLYHVLDTPTISDSAFDSLLLELIKLEKDYPEFQDKNSPTQKLGGIVVESFKKVKHTIRQYSFDKVFDFKELRDWEERNKKILEKNDLKDDFEKQIFDYIAELKIDGLKNNFNL